MDTIDEIKVLEEKVLAYLFHDKKYIGISLNKLNKNNMPNYYNLYSVILNYYQKYKDIITDNMLDLFFKNKNIDTNVIINYKSLISKLKSDTIVFNDGEFSALIDELEEKYKRKCVFTVAEKIANINPLNCSTNEFKDLSQDIKSVITKVTMENDGIQDEGSIKDSAKSRFEKYENIKNNPQTLNFIPTGFHHIDDDNGGFKPGELIYIIGRKGDGKSILMINFAVNMWKAGYNVIIFSLEIPKNDYERRIDACAAEIDGNGLKMGRLSIDDEKRYKEYLMNVSKNLDENGKKIGTLYIVDTPPGITPAFIDEKTSEVEQLLGIKFDAIISDYAGIMKSDIPYTEKRNIQGQIALDQKIIARTRKCVVISAAQKSRAGVGEKKSDSAYVAESDQVADHIDWGLDISSMSDEYGCIQTFKVRDAAPINFSFKKCYNMFKIREMDSSIDSWDQLK